ncbi:MAG: hypothetical protein KDD45_08405 [Bdellovibrionales bacterium]|nr:hypothetical protein [Bdellovibrionales bacterium]
MLPLNIASNILFYKGSFREGKFEGQGILHCKGKLKFDGTFHKGMRHGSGVIYF